MSALVNAEQCVLGSCLIDADAYAKIEPKLTPAHFSRPDHRLIFAAITTLASEGKGCDHVTVSAQLECEGRLAEAGGVAYLSQLARETPTSANIPAYAAFVRDHPGRGNGAARAAMTRPSRLCAGASKTSTPPRAAKSCRAWASMRPR